MQTWHFWGDLDFGSSDLESATFQPLPKNANLAFLGRSGIQQFTFEKRHFNPPPPPPKKSPTKNLAFFNRSELQEFRFEKCHFNTSPPHANLVFLERSAFQGFGFEKCQFTSPSPGGGGGGCMPTSRFFRVASKHVYGCKRV